MNFREEILRETNSTEILQNKVDVFIEAYYNKVADDVCNRIKAEIKKKASSAEYEISNDKKVINGLFFPYTGSYSFSKEDDELICIIVNHNELTEKDPYVRFDNDDGPHVSIDTSVIVKNIFVKKVMFSRDTLIREEYILNVAVQKLANIMAEKLREDGIETKWKIRLLRDQYTDYLKNKHYSKEEYYVDNLYSHEYRRIDNGPKFSAVAYVEYTFIY